MYEDFIYDFFGQIAYNPWRQFLHLWNMGNKIQGCCETQAG